MLDVRCQCGAQLNLPDHWAGKKGKCPACGGVISIPSAPEPVQLPSQPKSSAAKPSRTPKPTPTPAADFDAGIASHTDGDSSANGGWHAATEPASWPRSWWLAIASTGAVMLALIGAGLGRWIISADNGIERAEPQPIAASQTGQPPQREVALIEPIDSRPKKPNRRAKSPDAIAPPDRTAQAKAASPPSRDQAADSHSTNIRDATPAAAASTASPAPRVASSPPPRRPGGLSGGSRQYDDLDCQRIQAQHAVRIPAAATILEVDGQRLPLAELSRLAESRAPLLFLPRGVHAVKFRPGELPVTVEIETDLASVYQAMRQFFDAGGEIRRQELLSRGARTMDVHAAPFLLNLMGAAHVADEQWEAAERKFRRALRINPMFSPAHLNLAVCLARRDQADDARREVELADITNVGNVFGLAGGVSEVRRQLQLAVGEIPASEIAIPSYVHDSELSEEDIRLTALLEGISKYAVREEDRGKILNNLAVHFADTGRPELALDHFRSALAVIKTAGSERFTLARQVLSHMSDACRKAGFDEAEEYRQMQSLVSP